MTDAKHRAQEAAPPSERDAIVAFLRFVVKEADVHDAIIATINVVADAIERGDHLKETQA